MVEDVLVEEGRPVQPRDRETLDRYLSQAPVPRRTELMRKIGVEPEVRTFDILEFG